MRVRGAADGIAEAQMPASGWLMNPGGTVYVGALAMLADFAIAFAVYTTVPARHSFRSLDLKVNFLRAVRPDGRDLNARGWVVHAGSKMTVASGEVLDADGRQVRRRDRDAHRGAGALHLLTKRDQGAVPEPAAGNARLAPACRRGSAAPRARELARPLDTVTESPWSGAFWRYRTPRTGVVTGGRSTSPARSRVGDHAGPTRER
jgi:uncharacterized protein (TIGR00369 family)